MFVFSTWPRAAYFLKKSTSNPSYFNSIEDILDFSYKKFCTFLGMSLELEFNKISETVKRLKVTPTEDELLEMYALYKQAVVGDCNKPKPGTFDLKGKFKWEAWNRKKGMDQDVAKKKYIEYAEVIIKKYGVG